MDKTGEYFRRSFFAVDGLWFVMLEDELSFDKALKIDEKVWRVMPKIQSRRLKELYGIHGNTLRDLVAAVKIKLEMEGHMIEVNKISEYNTQILIRDCPWFNVMKQSGREPLAGKVGERICTIEYQGWADAFDKNVKFTLGSQLCKAEKACTLDFKLLK